MYALYAPRHWFVLYFIKAKNHQIAVLVNYLFSNSRNLLQTFQTIYLIAKKCTYYIMLSK